MPSSTVRCVSDRGIAVRGASGLMFREGKLSRAVYVWGVAGRLREIGLLPEL